MKVFTTLPFYMPEKDVLFVMCDDKDVDDFFAEQECDK